ncbi:MAG: alpha/beta fold hydrolase [Burkholderiales bacterium]
MSTQSNTQASSGLLQDPVPASYTHGHVEAAGRQLHYLDYGTQGLPPMLCVHGGAAHAHWFDYVAPGFTPKHHVRSIDLRGHGDSEWVDPPAYMYPDYAADLDEVVRRLDLRDFILVGHSMGGAVSLLYSATYPGRVKALIVIDSTVNLSPDRIAALRDVGSRSGRSYVTKEELVAKYRLRPGDSLAAPAVVRYIASHSAREQPDGTWKHKFDRNVYATREMSDGRPSWNRIKIPALLVKGQMSDRLNAEVFADVKSRCPHAELVEVSASHHHVTLDNPSEFVEKVKPFLDRVK